MLKILVVDDEQLMCQILSLALGYKGFQIVPALSGLEGLLLVLQENPDAITP